MPYVPFATASFTPSSTPPTTFAATAFAVSTTPPVAFGAGTAPLADIAALKAVPTTTIDPAGVGVGPIVAQVLSATAGEVMQAWQLVAGTDADNVGGGVARPTDYNGSTNANVWKRVL